MVHCYHGNTAEKMKNRQFVILILIMILLAAIASGCGKQTETTTATEVVYLPTRAVATLPVPTKAASCSNVLGYVEDVTYDDGAVVSPGQTFLKEWEVINYSDCNWEEGYHLFFISGNQMGAPDFVDIPHIPIGAKGKISVELTAPVEPGEYRSEWKLFGKDNRFFGESLVANITVSADADQDQQEYYW